MRRLLLATAALALACGYGDPIEETGDSADTAVLTDGCPLGMVVPAESGLLIGQLLVNSIAVAWSYDSEGVYNGRPAACVSADGTRAEWTFLVNEEPYGRISVTVPTTGELTPGQDGASMTVHLFGAATPATFVDGQWIAGQLSVTEDLGALAVRGTGSAVSGSENLMIEFVGELTQ